MCTWRIIRTGVLNLFKSIMRVRKATRNPGETDAWRFPENCFRNLAIGAFLQGMKDAVRGDERAMAWLLSTGLSWLDLAGFNITAGQVLSFVEKKKMIRKRAAETGERIGRVL